jgi:hypothetical protein
MIFAVVTGRSVGLASLTGLALLGAFWLGRMSAPAGPAMTPPPASEIVSPGQPAVLDANGVEAVAARSRELEAQVAWLQDQLARLGQEPASPPPALRSATPASAEARQTAVPAPLRRQGLDWKRSVDPSQFTAKEFDGSELLARGMPRSEVERLLELFDEVETERFEITQQAQREGGLDERRYQNEMLEFDLATREEVGDGSYDAMLYATGRDNRVKIRVLLEDSPGRSFGFESDDVVLSYDGHLVFNGSELRQTAVHGDSGQWVNVDVLRNGEIVHLQGQRGPIGAHFQPVRILPGATK